MRKFLFDVILGIFIAIGGCAVGIIAVMDKVDELKRRSYGFAEVVDNLVTDVKDLIHHLLYGYHHNRTYYKEWHSDINSRSCSTTNSRPYDATKTYSSMRNWWNGKTKDDEELKAESEYPREDDEEEASSGH